MFHRFVTRLRDWLTEKRWLPRLHPRADWRGPTTPPSPEVDERSLEQGLRLLEIIREQEPELCEGGILHVALGEQPLLPLLLSVAGCKEIIVVDHNRVMDVSLLVGTAGSLSRYATRIAQRLHLERSEILARLRCPRNCTFFEALRHFRIQYVAPYDLLEGTLETGSFNLITTRSLLDAYSPAYATAALKKLHTLLRPGGKLCLCIDQTDRYEYVTLLQQGGWNLEIDETHPILQVVDLGQGRPETDPRLLNAFLIACPRQQCRQFHRG